MGGPRSRIVLVGTLGVLAASLGAASAWRGIAPVRTSEPLSAPAGAPAGSEAADTAPRRLTAATLDTVAPLPRPTSAEGPPGAPRDDSCVSGCETDPSGAFEPGAFELEPVDVGMHFAPIPEADFRLLADLAPLAPGPVTAAGATMPMVAATGLATPVFATSMPGDPRVFVVEKVGRIRIVENGAIRPEPFLDIPARVGSAGSEQGLLGLAFDPDHARSGLFYIYYTNKQGDSVLARYEVGSDPNVAIPSRQEILLTVDQPAINHNGGTIAFSPVDGYLYLALGDGGGADDAFGTAQDGSSLLGKVLRLDVSGGFGSGYGIPADNPFVADLRVEDEVWALGLRNPYRFSFDSDNGNLWIGDVGQGAREEVDFEAAGSAGGLNFEWPAKEGDLIGPKPSAIAIGTATGPVLDYDHVTVPNDSCPPRGGSITGGIVYRGAEATLLGEYFFADFCTGELWSYDLGGDTLTDRTADLMPASMAPGEITALGEGGFNELYVVHASGTLYRIGPTGNECDDGIDNDLDGEIDVAGDTGCASDTDPSELDLDMPCDDGFDNDGDGLIDIVDPDCAVSASAAELPPEPNDGGGGSSGGGCGIGFELVLVLPALGWLRARRRARA